MNNGDDRTDLQTIVVTARDWLDKVCAHDATAEDETAMMRWRALSPEHAAALEDAMRLRRRMLAARDALSTSPAMQGLLTVPPQGDRTNAGPKMTRRAFLGSAVAASAAGMIAVKSPLGLWPSLAEMRADYRTTTGERRKVAVAPGLDIELNTRTAVARREDAAVYRLSLVAGEVAVDVRGLSRPVVIETDFGNATASDGHFGVQLKPEGSCVTCFAGQVDVVTPRAQRVTLTRGQRITIGGKQFSGVVNINPDTAGAWRRGELIFADRPLSEVVEELNRYRPGRIVLANSDLRNITVNAVFRVDSMDRAVSQIRTVSQASVTTLPGGIVLLS